MLKWWLSDIAPEDGSWSEGVLSVEQQGPQSGSCGLAAISEITAFALDFASQFHYVPVPPSIPKWTNVTSASFCRYWLQSILQASLHPLPMSDIDSVCCVISPVQSLLV